MTSINFLTACALTRGLKKFRGRHSGESCYIFGDGPSVKWFDLSHFGDRPGICCGMIPFHRQFHALDVRYVLFVSPWLFLPRMLQPREPYRELGAISAKYRDVVRSNPKKEFFVHVSNRFSLTGRNVNYVYRGIPTLESRTDRLLNAMNVFGGSFHASLSLAYLLGFATVHLIGFDAWTIQPARTMHWYEIGEGELFQPTNFATEFLGILGERMRICTVTADGESRNLRSVRYESFTGDKPHFRENYELLEEHHLAVLATYPGFKIFPPRRESPGKVHCSESS